MTNTNSHQNPAPAQSSQPHTVIEQILPTKSLVHSVARINGKHSAWSTRISPLDAASGISRPSARQPAGQTGEWTPRPAHNRLSESNRQPDPHQRQAVTLMQLNSHHHNEYCPDTPRLGTGSQTYTSGPTSGRGEEPVNPDNSQKVFTHAKRPPRGVRQDKGVLTNALAASRQPAPHKKDGRAHFVNKVSPRSQNVSRSQSLSIGRALVHSTIWQNPAVHAELKRIADEEGLSFSQVGATACEQWVHQRLHDRHEALLYPTMRQLVRAENNTLGNRLVFFQMRTAFAAEQTRILTTNILHKLTIQMGIPNDKFSDLVDKSNKMARRNIIARSPEFKSLFEEWNATVNETEDDRKEKASH